LKNSIKKDIKIGKTKKQKNKNPNSDAMGLSFCDIIN
jgi:hypothetical protein